VGCLVDALVDGRAQLETFGSHEQGVQSA
jgi:hypothetical protein